MKKAAKKTARGTSAAARKSASGASGSGKPETVKTGESKQTAVKPKTALVKAARPKPVRLEVSDLRADTFSIGKPKSTRVEEAVVPDMEKPERDEPKAARTKVAMQKPENSKKPQTSAMKPQETGAQGLQKLYVKSGRSCKVTFRLPKAAAPDAQMVTVVGDFNAWNRTETKMKKLKNGDFTTTVEVPCNREYRFRYLIDSKKWENDWCADKYLPNKYGSDDSVVIVEGNGV